MVRYLLNKRKVNLEGNIFADKSTAVLGWLLLHGINRNEFSIREVAKICKISVGLVQKVFSTLVQYGILETRGIRTKKQFVLSHSKKLLDWWLMEYSIIKKCKLYTYSSHLKNRDEALKKLKDSPLSSKVSLALHSSAKK